MNNVLITGITGLLGSSLARGLKDKDVNIVGVSRFKKDDYRTNYCVGDLKRFTMAYGSVGDYDFISNVINTYEIDTIFHFGAQAIVSTAELDPRGTFRSNIEGTINVLEAARQNKVKAVMTISSDKMYGHAPCPYLENGIILPREVYSTSKTCSDFITQCYGKNYEVPCIVIRSCNFFGPGDFNFTRLVPNTIIRTLKGERPYLWDGVSKYTREFIYTEDAIEIILRLMDKVPENKKLYGEAFNIGVGSVWEVEDFMNRVTQAVDPEMTVEIKEKEFEFKEIPVQYLNIDKLIGTIGKLPNKTVTDMNQCLDETVEFYREYFNL